MYVGTVEPRKNIDGLLDAYESLAPDIREVFDLVIASPAALDTLVDSPETARQLGERGRERARTHFTADAIVPRYEALYRDVMAVN